MGRPKRRRLGQTFLVDAEVAGAIAELTDPAVPRVFEIGPGRGALTVELARRFERVLALELDESLAPALVRAVPGSRVEVRCGDALTEPLEPLLAADAPWQVAANLPYSVGTAILRRLLPRHDLVSRVVVMLQREVVGRLLAEPAGSGHGLLALERAAYAEARLAFEVRPGAFRPRPRVLSAVAVLDLRPPPHPPEALAAAFGLAARALTRPRKVLTNALAPAVRAADLEAAGIDPRARPGTLDLAAWVRLAEIAEPT
jgi:16S rRNA (adenine1518-N6/adenine1519-N6)-dimethyltransferase